MIKIIIVEDHQIIVDGINAMLIGETEVKLINHVNYGLDIFEAILTEKPDIVVLDIKLPDVSGIDLAAMILEKYPEIKILILSAQDDEESILNSIKAGVKGYLSKDTSKEEFLKAIKFVYDGFEYFGSSISQIIYKSFVSQVNINENKKIEEAKLSEREKEIMIFLCEGLSFKEIADKLFISVRTIETHKKNFMEKLNIKTTADLVKYAIKNNFIKI
ncbi:MAG: response regulator transcription factor [Bacteroidales bacterium]|nr:response regulator transcription factor [Bacteroidales bacterium]